MPLDPDTEIQYRRGGKIMKKSPRKFQAGGATPAPATKPAPKGGPKELQEEAEKVRQEKLDEAQRKAGQRRPDLSKPFKKGGAVRKFNGEEGSVVEQPELRNEREGKDIYYTGRFKGEDGDETYRRAYAQANRLTAPSGEVEPEVKARTGLKEPSVRKAAPKRFAPKAAPKKVTPESDNPFKRGFDQSNAEDARLKRLGKKPEAPKRTGATDSFDKKPEDIDVTKYSIAERRAMTGGKRGSRAEDIYPSLAGKKAGGVVKKYAKGGGVEAKGKTKGKIVKMATGGSVRGYGVSKVTNKTKYC